MLNQFWARGLLANLKLDTASSVCMLYQQHVQEQLNAFPFSRELKIKANYKEAASYHPKNWRDYIFAVFLSKI